MKNFCAAILKRTSLISYTRKDLLAAAADIIRLAEAEGLAAHAAAIRKREESL